MTARRSGQAGRACQIHQKAETFSESSKACPVCRVNAVVVPVCMSAILALANAGPGTWPSMVSLAVGSASVVVWFGVRWCWRRGRARRGSFNASSPQIQLLFRGDSRRFCAWLEAQPALGREDLLDLAMAASFRNDARSLAVVLEATTRETNQPLRLSIGSGGWNKNPLFVALKRSHIDCARVLLERGVPIEAAFSYRSGRPIIESLALTGDLGALVERHRLDRRRAFEAQLRSAGLRDDILQIGHLYVIVAEYVGV